MREATEHNAVLDKAATLVQEAFTLSLDRWIESKAAEFRKDERALVERMASCAAVESDLLRRVNALENLAFGIDWTHDAPKPR